MQNSKMENDTDQLPRTIFGLEHHQHRAYRVADILAHSKAKVNKKAKKVKLLSHLAAQERTLFSHEERERISAWFRTPIWNLQPKPLLDRILVDAPFKSIECSVCMTSFPRYYFPRQSLAPECDHEPSVCITCIAQSLEHQIEEMPWDQIACPECPEALAFDVVKQFSTEESFRRWSFIQLSLYGYSRSLTSFRYDKKSVLAAFQDMPNFMMCLGPNCDSGQIHEGGDDQPIMTCTTCQFKTCFIHKMPWHTDQTCAQYDAEQAERTQQEAASAEFLARKTKVCPNPRCGLHVDKYSGCDHVRCMYSE